MILNLCLIQILLSVLIFLFAFQVLEDEFARQKSEQRQFYSQLSCSPPPEKESANGGESRETIDSTD